MRTALALVAVVGLAFAGAAVAVLASGREVQRPRTVQVAPASAGVPQASPNDWALIGAPPASFTITITGHPDAPLNGTATLTRAHPAGLNYGGFINGIQCLIYIEPTQNFLHFNAMRVIQYDPPNVTHRDSFRFIASAGNSPPQTGTFQLQGGGQIAISTP